MAKSPLASRVLLALPLELLYFYQGVTIGSPRRCRFEPRCSEYMVQSLQTRGIVKGLWAGLWRLLKCHPLHPGGYDPVPLKESFNGK